MTAEVVSYEPKTIDYNNFHQCPEDYKHHVIRTIAMQAYAEKGGAEEVGAQLRLAPDFRSRKALAKIAFEEAKHAYMLYEILENIGVTERESVAIAEGRHTSNQKKSNSLDSAYAVGNSDNEWFDLILNNLLMDRAGGFMVSNFSKSSFKPWAEACEVIYLDEAHHKSFGVKKFDSFIKENKKNLHKLALKFSQWFVMAMNFFGPKNNKSKIILEQYGIKRQSNEELRKLFIIDVRKLLAKRSLSCLILDNIEYNYPCRLLTE